MQQWTWMKWSYCPAMLRRLMKYDNNVANRGKLNTRYREVAGSTPACESLCCSFTKATLRLLNLWLRKKRIVPTAGKSTSSINCLIEMFLSGERMIKEPPVLIKKLMATNGRWTNCFTLLFGDPSLLYQKRPPSSNVWALLLTPDSNKGMSAFNKFYFIGKCTWRGKCDSKCQ